MLEHSHQHSAAAHCGNAQLQRVYADLKISMIHSSISVFWGIRKAAFIGRLAGFYSSASLTLTSNTSYCSSGLSFSLRLRKRSMSNVFLESASDRYL